MRTVVIGSGIAGLTAAIMLKEAGQDVTIITKGFGGLQLGQGTIDIFDAPMPLKAFDALPAEHPYHKISADSLREGLAAFNKVVPLEGNLEESTMITTALGALRRTGLYPPSFAAGAMDKSAKYLLVGFSGLKDFYPKLAAENLTDQGYEARAEVLNLSAAGDTALAYSRSLAEPGAAEELGARLGKLAREGERVGIPAVVREDVWARIQGACSAPVFQIPLPPPSIPGLEMNERLRQDTEDRRIRLWLNAEALGVDAADGVVTGIQVKVAGAVKHVKADAVVYAAGGLDSGAFVLDSYGTLSDTVFDLPIFPSTKYEDLVTGDYWGAPQPLFAAGLKVDSDMRPVGQDDRPVYSNLYAAGGVIGGAHRHEEKSGEGIALGSAAQAVAAILRRKA
ncbi:glycerol-3-phosphate dehydrogenase subunit GlpB [Ancrocorticia populi]|uniref:Glycerol-3-phosphate dehydrogenase subunit GlpB n=1 Tax=Ancrocorticia populi TaxID=2175228 RepID=A0A2V1K942_9ACTO|nr:glycerol-3-phosphate dehydrogenase subunit GlpB [Ancrocorticia populi]MDN6486428.1 glycerol-3-phosphate dehydrogenase subunit GlpB [Ancrocorticia sp.]PWF25954.1 glycerol-3-phosphate dehydrogenase subunit GlpB [Ancrocorticia populi]